MRMSNAKRKLPRMFSTLLLPLPIRSVLGFIALLLALISSLFELWKAKRNNVPPRVKLVLLPSQFYGGRFKFWALSGKKEGESCTTKSSALQFLPPLPRNSNSAKRLRLGPDAWLYESL